MSGFSIDINEGAGVDYGSTYFAAKGLGIDEVNFFVQWSDQEPGDGSMDLEVFELIELGNVFRSEPVTLTIAPCTTATFCPRILRICPSMIRRLLPALRPFSIAAFAQMPKHHLERSGDWLGD